MEKLHDEFCSIFDLFVRNGKLIKLIEISKIIAQSIFIYRDYQCYFIYILLIKGTLACVNSIDGDQNRD
jgi:hypothetical protein